jgi:hypothetical protein
VIAGGMALIYLEIQFLLWNGNADMSDAPLWRYSNTGAFIDWRVWPNFFLILTSVAIFHLLRYSHSKYIEGFNRTFCFIYTIFNGYFSIIFS